MARLRYRGKWHINVENKKKNQNMLTEEKRYRLIDLPHGPLIDIKLLDEVVEKLDDSASPRVRCSGDHIYLLTGILEYEDGSTFYGQPAKGKQYRYYYNRKNDVRIRCDELDDLVIKRLKKYLRGHECFIKLVEQANKMKSESLSEVEAELKQLREELQKINEAESDIYFQLKNSEKRSNPDFMEWLEDQVCELKSEKDALKKKMDTCQRVHQELTNSQPLDNTQKLLSSALRQFSKLTPTQKKRFVTKVIKRIIVKEKECIEIHLAVSEFDQVVEIADDSEGRLELTETKFNLGKTGRGCKTRTCDPPVMSRML